MGGTSRGLSIKHNATNVVTSKTRLDLTFLYWEHFIEEQLYSISVTVMKLIFINSPKQWSQVLVKHEITCAKFPNNFQVKYQLKNLCSLFSRSQCGLNLLKVYLLSTIYTEN